MGPSSAQPHLDELIEAQCNSFDEKCSATELDQHVRALCQILIERQASGIVTNAAFDRLNKRLGECGHSKLNKRDWNRILKECAATAAINNPPTSSEAGAPTLQTKIRDVLADAPVPEQAVVPLGWKLSPAGVFRTGPEQDVLVLPSPLLIMTRLVDDAEKTESVRLAWKRDGAWHERVCPRSTIAVTRDITTLADYGLPVHSLNAGEVVAYLAAFEADNALLLPRIRIRRQLGWTDPQLSGFLWGRTYLTASRPPQLYATGGRRFRCWPAGRCLRATGSLWRAGGGSAGHAVPERQSDCSPLRHPLRGSQRCRSGDGSASPRLGLGMLAPGSVFRPQQPISGQSELAEPPPRGWAGQ